MFRHIAKFIKHGFKNEKSQRSRFPSYRQVLRGGFGELNGGTYILEMKTFPFKEEDIKVQVKQNEIMIEGRLEERHGDDFMQYMFTKKCLPPTGVDVSSIEYKFNGDKLVLTARTNN